MQIQAVLPERPSRLTLTMQDTGRTFVRYINSADERTGSVWEGRCKAGLPDSEAYLLTCMPYIELNPVRPGMVQHPGEYRWSSFAVNAQARPDTMLTCIRCICRWPRPGNSGKYAYRELYVRDLHAAEVHQIRQALDQELVSGREDVKARIEQMLNRQARRGFPGFRNTFIIIDAVYDRYQGCSRGSDE